MSCCIVLSTWVEISPLLNTYTTYLFIYPVDSPHIPTSHQTVKLYTYLTLRHRMSGIVQCFLVLFVHLLTVHVCHVSSGYKSVAFPHSRYINFFSLPPTPLRIILITSFKPPPPKLTSQKATRTVIGSKLDWKQWLHHNWPSPLSRRVYSPLTDRDLNPLLLSHSQSRRHPKALNLRH